MLGELLLYISLGTYSITIITMIINVEMGLKGLGRTNRDDWGTEHFFLLNRLSNGKKIDQIE